MALAGVVTAFGLGWWLREATSGGELVGVALLLAGGGVAACLLYSCLIRQGSAGEGERSKSRAMERFAELCVRAPVPILQKDFSGVAAWLEKRGIKTVAEMERRFSAQPKEALECFGLLKLCGANRAALEHFKASSVEELERRIGTEAKPERLELLRHEAAAILEGRDEFTHEWSHAEQGRVYFYRVYWSAPRLAGGKLDLSSVLVVLLDITQVKRVEAALRDSEVRYRRLFEDSPSPMWVFDAQTLRFLAVNAAAIRQYGYTAGEFLEMDALSIRSLQDAPQLLASIDNLALGETVTGVWKHRRKDGTTMLMQVENHAHEFAGRRAVLGLMRDVTDQQEAEKRLRASEARYRLLFEGAVEGVYEADLQGALLSANPAMARILGFDDYGGFLERLKTTAVINYVAPKRIDELLAQLSATDALTGFESEVICVDGATRWISESVRALRDEQGRITRLQGFVADITERRRAELVTRDTQERLRIVLEQTPVAILQYDYREVGAWLHTLRAEGVIDLDAYLTAHPEITAAKLESIPILGINQETVRLANARDKAHLLENFHIVSAPNQNLVRRLSLIAIWQGRYEFEGEIALRTVDLQPRSMHYRWWVPIQDGKPRLEWTQMALIDLTDIRKTQAELAAERERLRVTLRAMAEALITTDTNGVVEFMNEAAERITGWSVGAAAGHGVEQVCSFRHEDTKANITMPVALAISEHRVVEFPQQTILSNRNGTQMLIDGRCAPMHDIGGRAIGAVLVFRDVTERSRLESELIRSSKLESVGILAGGIAHDFNNILTVVMGNVTLAMLDSHVMSIAGRWLGEAEKGVMRARDLTQQLLTFAKGGQPIRQLVHLPEIVREASEFALHGSTVRCEFHTDAELWTADVDPGQISQVVQNLVINAVQAMPEGGVIRIVLQNDYIQPEASGPLSAGHYVGLSIIDGGSGIAPGNVARIFDPYFTTKKSGSGLGLATVYSVVRRHKGHIEVDSRLGVGTTFRIWLPAAPDAKPATLEKPEKIGGFSGRVLFMDDEDTIRVVASMLLKRLGFAPLVVADGGEAIRAYNEARATGNDFALVIMDLTVPGGMGGRDALQELLKIDPAVRAIVSSGYSSDPVLANHRAFGFRGMVSKPYKLSDLSREIRSVLEENP